MTETKRYNGWTNYETWNVALWLGNDEGSYRYWQDVSQEALDDTDVDEEMDTRRERAALEVCKRLKDEIEDDNPLANENSLYSDILSAALSETNWYEIAKSWVDDLDPAETSETDEDDDED